GVAVMQFETPLDFPEGTQLKVAWRMGDMLGCGRFSVTTAAAPAAPAVDHAAILALQAPPEQRTTDQSHTLFSAWRNSVPDLKPINDEIAALWKTMPVAGTSILHMAEREPGNHRATWLLDRGEWDQPLKEVKPHTPAAFHP